eukprot:GFUD01043732.1.p1 GENE.GFUD01043732.1~~GFUD01043732.1.p1  ORF type:complete len:829 (-),score=244.19 GFUD01043732.1:674-3160(-)
MKDNDKEDEMEVEETGMETEDSMMEDSVLEEDETDSFLQEDRDSFLQPCSKSRFTLRKRKRRLVPKGEIEEAPDTTDGDNVSICSLDMEQEQPETKKKRNLPRISSLSSMLSLSKPISKKVGKMGSALQKSLSSSRFGSPVSSMRTPSRASLARSASTVFGDGGCNSGGGTGRTSPGSVSLQEGPAGWGGSPFRRSSVNLTRKSSTSNLTPYRVPGPTPSKSRPTRYWSEVYSSVVHKLTKQEVKLQEAVFEIFNGEEDLVEDLKLVRKTYADSLIHLNILSQSEEQLVFGHMSALAPLHQQFHVNLSRAQCKDGFWFEIGPAVEKWIKTVQTPYVNYCSNLTQAKAFLDKKQSEDKSFSDFLQRCLESPFSRKLDLWSYLDVPRSRLVKYPLLLKQVLKYSEDPDDIKTLTESIKKLEKIINIVDTGMAQAKCAASISTMEFLSSTPPQCVALASEEIMSGSLRNSRGTKVMVCLVDTALIVGRQVTRPGIGKVVQVYREPIPTNSLVCTDLADGEAVKPGSFHRAFSSTQNTSRNAFRVSWSDYEESMVTNTVRDPSTERSHTLVAPDEHTKRQWVATIQKTIQKVQASPSEADGSPKPTVKITPRASPRRLNKVQKKLSGELLNLSTRNSSPKLISASKLVSTPNLVSKVKSNSKLMSASKLMSPTGRTGIFRKKTSPAKSTKSPLIKSSLSQSTMEKLQSGGVKKLRMKQRKNDENLHRGGIVMDGSVLGKGKSSCQLLSKTAVGTAVLSSRRTKSAAVMAAINRRRRPAERRMLQLIDENTRPISKSLIHLAYTAYSPNQPSPRYLTRRTAKLSKSMNDLLHL